MPFRKNILLVMLFVIANVSFAGGEDEKIVCPSVDIIKQSAHKIDTAYGGKYDDSYSTSASSSYYDASTHLSWFISANVPNASSKENAISIGRTIAHDVQFSKNPYATVYTDNYGVLRISCDYGPGGVSASARNLSEDQW